MKHLSTAGKGLTIPSLCGILGTLSVFIVIFFGRMNGVALATVLKLCILSVVLLSIAVFYISSQQEKIKELPGFTVIFTIIYICSLLLIMLTKERPELTVWMSGGLIIAILFNMYLGYIVTFNFILISSFAGGLDIEYIVYLLILGSFMCLLSGYMKKLTTLGYSAVIVLSMQLILIFIINNFMLKNSLNIKALYSLVSSLFSIILSYGIYSVYGKKVQTVLVTKPADPILWNKEDNKINSTLEKAESNVFPEENKPAANMEEGIASEYNQTVTRTMDEILDTEFPLLVRLKQYSMKVYEHSRLIGEIAGMAAYEIGADEQKAKAGGFYHEVGRIENKEYVEEGVKLAEAYHLPGFITDIIRQHNLKYEKPKSPEAAIVMITISIIATKEYLEKAERNNSGSKNSNVPIEKIVDNVFQMRLTRGSLDESGLSLKQYNQLKEFFLHM